MRLRSGHGFVTAVTSAVDGCQSRRGSAVDEDSPGPDGLNPVLSETGADAPDAPELSAGRSAGWLWRLVGLVFTLWLVAAVAVAQEYDPGADPCPAGGVAFADVPEDHFAAVDIACLNALGIIRGTGPDTFSPGAPVTRSQVAALLARTWRHQGQVCPGGLVAFSDVPEDHFAAVDIACLNALGIIRGTGPDTFSPGAPVTRSQVAALLARMWPDLGAGLSHGAAGLQGRAGGSLRGGRHCLSLRSGDHQGDWSPGVFPRVCP